MKICLLSLQFAAISLVVAQKDSTQSNLRRGSLSAPQRALQDEYKYSTGTMFCQPSFCANFFNSCPVTANPVNQAVPYSVSSGADYCMVTLSGGVEITCNHRCDGPMGEAQPRARIGSRGSTTSTRGGAAADARSGGVISVSPPPTPQQATPAPTPNPTPAPTPEPTAGSGGGGSLPKGEFQIRRQDASNNLCLELEDYSHWSNVFQTQCNGSNRMQKWIVVEKNDGQVFTLSPADNTGLCLDMERSRMNDLQLYDCKTSGYTRNQEFDTQFFHDSNGKLFIDEKCVYIGEHASVDDRVLGDDTLNREQCSTSSNIPEFIFE